MAEWIMCAATALAALVSAAAIYEKGMKAGRRDVARLLEEERQSHAARMAAALDARAAALAGYASVFSSAADFVAAQSKRIEELDRHCKEMEAVLECASPDSEDDGGEESEIAVLADRRTATSAKTEFAAARTIEPTLEERSAAVRSCLDMAAKMEEAVKMLSEVPPADAERIIRVLRLGK